MLIIVPTGLQVGVAILGVVAFIVFLILLYFSIVQPVRAVLLQQQAQPPDVGFTYEIVMGVDARTRNVSIGLLDSDIKTQLHGISENHVILRLRKEPDMEEYTVYVVPRHHLYYRGPHATKLELLRETTEFESHELIGHPALLRVVGAMQHNRPLQYLDFELSCDYFFNVSGQERMRFLLKLTKIHPGVDRIKPIKRGIYRFARQTGVVEEEESSS